MENTTFTTLKPLKMTPDKTTILERCNTICKNTLMETLSIEFVDVGADFITARMPVNSRVHQPDGVLHGGASVALAESVGSAAALVFMNDRNVRIRGIEIAANHVKSVRTGFVFARATAVHLGRTTQLWQIKITNPNDELVSLIKLTTLSLPAK